MLERKKETMEDRKTERKKERKKGRKKERKKEREREFEKKKKESALTNKTPTDMSANRWKYFRWTPRTAWITFVYVVAVPSLVGYVGFVTEVS